MIPIRPDGLSVGCRIAVFIAFVLCCCSVFSGCGVNGPALRNNFTAVTVNSLDDAASVPAGKVTLRYAIECALSGQTVTFDPSLNGGTILLGIIGSEHSILKGETYSGMSFDGYRDRDYGRSALYFRKNIRIDASNLPDGITIKWNGGASDNARVLAVYGDLYMNNVTVSSGHSFAEAIAGSTQPYTLARGGGIAVWGTATLENCRIIDNMITGDPGSSRDRGAYGGGIYANGLILTNCLIGGNSATGYGAAGGGIYSVGGADNTTGIGNAALLEKCSVTGNSVTAQHAYGGGIFTLSGGPINLAEMRLTNCTVSRNLARDNPAIDDAGQFYYRGGGIYMGGGSVFIDSCTIAENEIKGTLTSFSGKPNMGGGGIGATIGNAHVIENMKIQHTIIAGNRMNDATDDIFSGSLLDFLSCGYNLFGSIDFSQILVPVPQWTDLSRKHYPKAGDREGMVFSQIISLPGSAYEPSVLSAGIHPGGPVVLWYKPSGEALDRIPASPYYVNYVKLGYSGYGAGTDDFLNHVLDKIRTVYVPPLDAGFGSHFGDMTGVSWYGPATTWTTNPANSQWITFWRSLDSDIGDKLGMVKLGDDFWSNFSAGALDAYITVTVDNRNLYTVLAGTDQRGSSRPQDTSADIGAIEIR